MITVTKYPEIGGVAEIAEEFGVRATVVSMWGARRASNSFPLPIKPLKSGPVYDMAEVRRWFRNRYPEGSVR
jgi:hypothetical protein